MQMWIFSRHPTLKKIWKILGIQTWISMAFYLPLWKSIAMIKSHHRPIPHQLCEKWYHNICWCFCQHLRTITNCSCLWAVPHRSIYEHRKPSQAHEHDCFLLSGPKFFRLNVKICIFVYFRVFLGIFLVFYINFRCKIWDQ